MARAMTAAWPFTAGETISVSWAVGQPHGGSLTIDFAAADDTGFRQYVLATDVSDAEGMPTSIDVQLPDIDCDACTLRLTQINPNDDEYYSCADITLSGASAGSTGGSESTAGDESTGSPGASTGGGDSSTGEPEPGSTSDDSASASASASATGASATVGGGSAEGTGDGGSSSGAAEDEGDSGCSCTSDRGANRMGALVALGLGLLARRRRR